MSDRSALNRFFVAIIPPSPIQEYAITLMQMLGDRYRMRASKSPPHITLYAPFDWPVAERSVIETALHDFTQNLSAISIQLSGFNSFRPRVLYVHVEKTPELLNLHAQLMDHLEATLGLVDPVARRRPFTPHMTLASRNITRKTFTAAWDDLQPHARDFEFKGDRLTLLQYRGDRWQVQSEHPFTNLS